MITRRPQTSESFAHVANRVLRGVLESRSGEVEPAQMRQALKRTLAALQRDVITDDPALEQEAVNRSTEPGGQIGSM